MNPDWRTTVVQALCRRMLDSRSFDVLPILADALQDAGCEDEELLTPLRAEGLDPVHAERLVNLIYSEETAAAVHWLEQFAREIGDAEASEWDEYAEDLPQDLRESQISDFYTYESLIRIGHEAAKGEEIVFGFAGADFFMESEGNGREFFRHWSLVTGTPVPDADKVQVRCAC